MLIDRPKRFPGPNYKIAAAIKARLGRAAGPRLPFISTLNQSRAYVLARVNGAPVPEAKQLAGIGPGINSASILERPETKAVIDELSKKKEFRNPGLVKRLKQMWHHKRVRFQKVGDDVEQIYEDDTDMWKYSMDRVLELRGLRKRSSEEEQSNNNVIATTGITFNVLQVPESK